MFGLEVIVVDLSGYTVPNNEEQLPPVTISKDDYEASKTVFGWE